MPRLLCLLSLVLAASPSVAGGQRPSPSPKAETLIPVADWPAPGRDPGLTRFSPLTELTPANVNRLGVKWTFGTGSLRGHEGNPLVVGGHLFLQTPHPTSVYAFDLDRPGDPPLWRYAPPAGRDPALSVCCGVSSRGMAWHPSGKIYVPLFPGDLAAIDMATGKEIWKVRNGDPALGITMQAAPLVVGDVVIVGTGGGEYGTRGYLTGFDALTGKRLWRAYSTGSDADVLLTAGANPGYPSYQGHDLGVRTWTADSWRRGGGATWGWLSYDPDLDLIYYGTGAPAPLNPDQRLGENKWTSSIIAREPQTGALRWVVQLTPGDRWGFDATNESILVELEIGGRPVKALVHFDRNGFAYTIDRVNGRILVAEKYGPANWASRVDLSTAEPVIDSAYAPATGRPVKGVCPSTMGMKAFQPAAFSPSTGLFYVPATNLCMDITPVPTGFTAGQPFIGATVKVTPGPGGNRGRFLAWDAATGTIAWEAREPYPIVGGALVTAGGVVFYGTLDGWFKALDATSGRELWRFKTPSGIVGSPITFSGPDGRQYVAVVSGLGGPVTGLGEGVAGLDREIRPGGVLLVFGF